MSTTDKAWTNLVDCFFLKCRGESWLELKDAINAYTAAAVAEARAPLMEALRACHALLQDAHYEYDLLGRNFCGPDVAKVIEAAAAALVAKETP